MKNTQNNFKREVLNFITDFFWAIVIGVFLLYLLINWSNKHDTEVEQAAQRYEACVQEQYGVTPRQFYLENGEYPTCE